MTELLPDFRLLCPTKIDEAVKMGAQEPDARFLGGGTDMVVNVRRGIEQPGTLIDLTGITSLKEIAKTKGGLAIGAGVTLDALAGHQAVAKIYPAIAQAAAEVAGPTHRRYGTVGGNLCLDTRCIFYNQSEWWRSTNAYCLKHRGETCHVAPGGKRCFAAFSGDVAPALLIAGAEVTLAGPGGERRVPLGDIYNNDGLDHLALEAGEILTVVHLPKATAGVPAAYAKARVRGSIDFPLAGAAVSLAMSGAEVKTLGIAVTGVAPMPHVIKGTGDFTGRVLDDDALDELREMVRRQSKPMHTTTIAPKYRRRVVGVLARRLAAGLA